MLYSIVLSQCEEIGHHKMCTTSVHRDPLPIPNLANFQLIMTWPTAFIVLLCTSEHTMSYFTVH